MNRTLSSLLTLTILVIFNLSLISCSTKPIHKKPKRRYSDEVEKEFQDIEYDRKRVLNYYRTLREKNWKEYKYKGNQISRRRYSPTRIKSKPTVVRIVPSPTPKPERPELSPEKVEEINIEIHQNLSYFCMKNRKSGKFSDHSTCLDFTQNIFNECKQKYPIYRDRSPISCIKNKLH